MSPEKFSRYKHSVKDFGLFLLCLKHKKYKYAAKKGIKADQSWKAVTKNPRAALECVSIMLA